MHPLATTVYPCPLCFPSLQVDHFARAMEALDADPNGLSARTSALGRRRPPRPVNDLSALDYPHKCYNDWHIPLVPLPAVAGGGNATGEGAEDAGGWRYAEVEKEGGREIHKRGWLASRPGAAAEVHVNTAWGGEGIDPGALVGVSIGCERRRFERAAR